MGIFNTKDNKPEKIDLNPVPETKKVTTRIEPKKMVKMRDATAMAETLSDGGRRLLYTLYGVAHHFKHVDSGGAMVPEFVGQFEAVTPNNQISFSAKRCYLQGHAANNLIEKIKAGESVEFVVRLFLVKSASKFTGFEYKADLVTSRQADPLSSIRKEALEK